MSSQHRYLQASIEADLHHKMVFVGGPRQVGKTTLAKALLSSHPIGYFNWDIADQRQQILERKLPSSALWVFDEIHKYRQWRNYLKGLFDAHGPAQQILVTGSARLDLYRYGGDSLQGRYHYLRLHPLSVAELGITRASDFEALLHLGGFPEPFFRGSAVHARRWSREYRSRMIREDVVDVERVLDLGQMELMALRLPELVGSPLSVNNLREDLQTSHKTLSRWLSILERLYAIFRLSPFGAPKIRAVKKEQKHYHFDWTLVPKESASFENLVAAHLLKWVDFHVDKEGRELELRYFRDVDGREVDFVVTENRRPIWLIEARWSDEEISPALRYLHAKFPKAEAWQVSAMGKNDYVSKEGIRVAAALRFLSQLT